MSNWSLSLVNQTLPPRENLAFTVYTHTTYIVYFQFVLFSSLQVARDVVEAGSASSPGWITVGSRSWSSFGFVWRKWNPLSTNECIIWPQECHFGSSFSRGNSTCFSTPQIICWLLMTFNFSSLQFIYFYLHVNVIFSMKVKHKEHKETFK